MTYRKDALFILGLLALVLGVFWKATLGEIFYVGDIYQLHYPLRSAYARELSRLSLPLWSTEVLAGYPLLAEGQLGALYPPNLFLHLLFPVHVALNLFILAHFVLAAAGTYAFVRHLGAERVAALLSGIVFSLSGFLVAHLNHVNIVATAAWLPWALLLANRLMTANNRRDTLRSASALAVVFALDSLAGHVQIALLTLLAVSAYVLYLFLLHRSLSGLVAFACISVALGMTLAAAQLLPSYELTQLSVRAGGLDPRFFTSFSLHPLYLVTLFAPFIRGNPYPTQSVELVGYLGWLPLCLAGIAPLLRASRPNDMRLARHEVFFALLAVVALFLSFGRWNPVYMRLLAIPPFNLFRVPARYLLLFDLAGAVLAGLALDALLRRARSEARARGFRSPTTAILGTAPLALLATVTLPSLEALLLIWRWLPVVLAVVSIPLVLIAVRGRLAARHLAALVLLVTVTDIVAFNGVYNRTYNQTMPADQFVASPHSSAFFAAQPGLYRLHTHEEIVPVLSVMRESYYPNLTLLSGLSATNGLFPLVPARYNQYITDMTPRMFDLLNARFLLIPQLLPVDEASEAYDLHNPFSPSPVAKTVTIPETGAAQVEIESYLSHSVDWQDGEPVAEIKLRGRDGREELLTLRAGQHTAEWAYNRTDVQAVVQHSQPLVARVWPARSGFPPQGHSGYTYRATFPLARPLAVESVEITPLIPAAYIRIERLNLVDSSGERHALSDLAGWGDHTLAYRSEDVAIYVNHDALPRAFVVHEARAVHSDEETLAILHDPAFDPSAEVLLATEQVEPLMRTVPAEDDVQVLTYDARHVVLQVKTSNDGYLVLADAWYPGWRASIDGQETPILRANLIFRALRVTAGQHTVEFTYQPASFSMGLLLGGIAAALLGIVALLMRK